MWNPRGPAVGGRAVPAEHPEGEAHDQAREGACCCVREAVSGPACEDGRSGKRLEGHLGEEHSRLRSRRSPQRPDSL